jgi:hypothetical protein
MAAVVGKPPAIALTDALAMVNDNEDPANLVEPKDPNRFSMEGLNLVDFDNRIDASRLCAELGRQPRICYTDAFHEVVQSWNARTIANQRYAIEL